MQEKVWLHTDRPSYHAGDTIRFRAFLVDAATHRPSPYSRFVYVDLVNRRDSVLKKVKLALIDSVFAGYLKVPEDIRQGEYFCGVILTGCRIWGKTIFIKRESINQSVGFEGC